MLEENHRYLSLERLSVSVLCTFLTYSQNILVKRNIHFSIEMKSPYLLACLFLLIFQGTATAQKQHRIQVDMVKNIITINSVQFTDSSTIMEYERLLGRAERIIQKRGADQFYAYDKLGIALSLREDTEIVNEIYITYSANDGDGRAAKEVFRGELAVNNQPVDGMVARDKLSKHAKVDLVEVMNGYFITPKRALNLLLYYPQDVPYTTMKHFGLIFSSAK